MRVRARIAAAAIALGALGFVAVPAASAGQPPPNGSNATTLATPNRCGSGYSLIDSERLDHTGRLIGVVYLYYSNATGKNCAFTEKLASRGTPTLVIAQLQRGDGHQAVDRNKYKYYAGPVYMFAPGACIKWGGSVTTARPDDREDNYLSPWEHCG
jgi:hypothetical protein